MRPWLQFLLLGIALFVGVQWQGSASSRDPEAYRVVLDEADLETLRRETLAQWGRLPTEGELGALVEARVDDEILFREARRLGWDRTDIVVRRRLVQNLRFVSGAEIPEEEAIRQAYELGMEETDPVVRRRLVQRMRLLLEAAGRETEPTEEELEAHLESHRARFETPPRVRFTHFFYGSGPRGESAEAEAAEALVVLREGGTPRSDPHLAGREQPLQSVQSLARYFGEAFGLRLFELPVGEWTGPIRSPHGWHLVRVEERTPRSLPALDTVRNEVRYAVLAERGEQARRASLARLRERYTVEIAAAPAEG